MRLAEVTSTVLGPAPPPDTLYVLCVLADWNPVCSRVEAALEAANGRLAEEAAGNKGAEAGRIQVGRGARAAAAQAQVHVGA